MTWKTASNRRTEVVSGSNQTIWWAMMSWSCTRQSRPKRSSLISDHNRTIGMSVVEEVGIIYNIDYMDNFQMRKRNNTLNWTTGDDVSMTSRLKCKLHKKNKPYWTVSSSSNPHISNSQKKKKRGKKENKLAVLDLWLNWNWRIVDPLDIDVLGLSFLNSHLSE